MASNSPSTDEYESILWRRIDIPGHEFAELHRAPDGWQLRGTAVLSNAGMPCRLEYDIRCDRDWITQVAAVTGRIGENAVDLELLRNPAGEWTINGSKVWELTGCDDIDLNFSPSTNLLPIRRLALAVGDSARVRAAWLKFPGMTLEVLAQEYTRTGVQTYRYASANGSFTREITVDAAGFVLDYPDFWLAEARSRGSVA